MKQNFIKKYTFVICAVSSLIFSILILIDFKYFSGFYGSRMQWLFAILNFYIVLFCFIYIPYFDNKKRVKPVNLITDTFKQTEEQRKLSIAARLHDSYDVQSEVDEVISEAFRVHEPEIYDKLEFSVGSDFYDNSIEIYFKVPLPYPYEPCEAVRKAIYDLGFNIVFWNFMKDITGDTRDEIRGNEPRHYKDGSTWIPSNYGYVDKRFNQKDWDAKYNFRKRCNNC